MLWRPLQRTSSTPVQTHTPYSWSTPDVQAGIWVPKSFTHRIIHDAIGFDVVRIVNSAGNENLRVCG